ncbi:MAG: alanine--tRNA ligase [Bacteroidetes bacterium]|nr:alanine--tRNA ligase [Bacteroidota bacterium]
MNSTAIRQAFLDYFKSKGHQILPSAPMVIKNDPTLMFTNAGMNQFKDLFLGNREASFKRVADTQKCLRVSGKHNDLEEVGIDTYHHTMFEMLGNWSFGDYFKKEAIEWGWEFLTEIVKIQKDRMYVTVFEGDAKEGLERDTEAFDYWRALIPQDRILMGSKKDNFWEMGDTGPCGPCSEIHVDLRDDKERSQVTGHLLVNTGNPLVIEIWNLVFIQYNRQTSGQLNPLPARHVDTGMGFERLCMVLQGKKSNYDTDVFQPLIHHIAGLAEKEYGSDVKTDTAIRVIADHIRAISFAIADGQLPSNVKAGYVIRRILRRAVRYGYTFLGFRDPFLYTLAPVLINQMGIVFPELISQKDLIVNVVKEEETAFLRTLATGIQKFTNYIGCRMQDAGSRILHPASHLIDGGFAFELFDTYGFPIDLTQLMAREAGWEVDMEGFRKGLEEQKSRSRQAASVQTSDWVVVVEDSVLPEFVGYDTLKIETEISRYRKIVTRGQELYHIVLDQTPFYAESGGQVGDKGWLSSGNQKITVIDTLKENDLIIHICDTIPVNPEQPVIAEVDSMKRRMTANNHSATHLMHSALRKVLGTHVEQKGSLVDDEHLRFDFTHFAKLGKDEIEAVEKIVNSKIRENIRLNEERAMPIADAKKIGAMALFGEKYGDFVRVVTFDPAFSVEFCGGTHVASSGQIGLFKIISESAIAAGVRRIEAITAEKAESWFYEKLHLLDEVSETLKNPKDLLKGMKNLVEENQALRKDAAELAKIRGGQVKEDLIKKAEVINGITFISAIVDLDTEIIKNLAFELRTCADQAFIVLANESDGKAGLTVAVSDALVKAGKLNAGTIIREIAKEVQGGGGGQPHIATAGGKNPAGIPAALERAREIVSRES